MLTESDTQEQQKLMKPKKLPPGLSGRIVGFKLAWNHSTVDFMVVVIIDDIQGRGSERAKGERSLRFDKQFSKMGLFKTGDRIKFSAHIPVGNSHLTHVKDVRRDTTTSPQTTIGDFSEGGEKNG